MKRLLLIGISFLLVTTSLFSQQGNLVPATRDTTFYIQKDDPIAAALDSLAYLRLFESSRLGSDIGRQLDVSFSADSVPIYSNEVIAKRIALLDAQSPFKLVFNDEVKGYINMYAVRKRNQVSRMMGLSELYFPLFEEMLAKHKLPLELKYLAIIESALNPAARSRAGAQGLWQFMYGTGKLFGLKINSYVDERCDPIKSTEAAVLYMKYLYGIYKDWALVLAAYNSGPGNVNKAIRRSGGKTNYWELRPYLPKETAGYVPAFIAATYVMNYAKEHNLHPILPRAIFSEIDTIHITKRVTFRQLATTLDMKVEDVEFLNPSYILGVIPEAETYHVLTLPKAKIPLFINNEQSIYAYKSPSETKLDSLISIRNAVSTANVKYHTVKSGENLTGIAVKYKVSVNDLRKWNNLKSNRLLRGQKLKVSQTYKEQIKEVAADAEKTQVETEKTEAPENTEVVESLVKYKVKPGDTLWKIAVNYGMTLEDLRKKNNLTNRSVIKAGQILKVKPKG